MAKSYEPCYTRQSKSGTYTTCEGAQKKRKAKAKLKKGGDAPPMVKKKGKSKPPPKKKPPPQENPEGFGKKFIFGRNMAGRVNTGPLNPGAQTLSVNPWGTTPEPQAQQNEIDTSLFLEVSAIMTDTAKENRKRGGADLRERLRTYSPNQLKTALRKSYEEDNPGRSYRFPRNMSMDSVIEQWIKLGGKEKFLPKKAIGGTGQTKHLFILEGWGLFPDDEDEDYPDYIESISSLRFKQSYPSGLQRYEGRMTDSEALAFGRDFGKDGPSRFYRETAKTRKQVWDNL